MPTHSHTADHTHTINDPTHNHAGVDSYMSNNSGDDPGGIVGNANYGSSPINIVNPSGTGITINSASVTTNNQGSGQAHNNMQPYIVLNYIVKVK